MRKNKLKWKYIVKTVKHILKIFQQFPQPLELGRASGSNVLRRVFLRLVIHPYEFEFMTLTLVHIWRLFTPSRAFTILNAKSTQERCVYPYSQ